MSQVSSVHPPHLYIHIPYCQAKCPYCDFNSIAGREDEFNAYVDALLMELARLPRGPYATIYLGGGTPTILPPALLERLLVGINGQLDLADGYEWTCEANPGSADSERFQVLADHGVNRISVGVQSTHPHHLRFLGRVHSADEAHRCLEQARACFSRVNADLIFGLPDQTDAELDADLALYRRHGLDHASVYHLMIEPGTTFAGLHKQGALRMPPDERSEAQFAQVRTGLAALGLPAYETSNYARPGQESRHNLAYWRQRDYQACGAGAVSTVAGQRCTREKHPGRYIAAIAAGGDAIVHQDLIGALERLRECWMLGLRMEAGVAKQDLILAGDDEQRWSATAVSLCNEGLLIDNGSHLRLSDAGRPLQDHVTVALMP